MDNWLLLNRYNVYQALINKSNNLNYKKKGGKPPFFIESKILHLAKPPFL